MSRWRQATLPVDPSPRKPPAAPDPGAATANSDSAAVDHAGLVTLRGFLERLSAVIAPSTLVIALAYWFGWTLTNARSAYFGIDSSTLGYSTTDYLLRSADAAFVPIAVVLLALLGGIVIHGSVQRAIAASRRGKTVKAAVRGAAIAGAVLSFFGVWGMFRPLPATRYYLLPPIILGLGPALVAYSVWTLRQGRNAGGKERAVPAWERSGYAIAATIALLGVFWASSLYAAALGRGRAADLAANLAILPAVTVFSVKSLGIDAAGVSVSRIADSAAAYQFRYSGLRLLVHSANKYFMVNSSWSRERGVTIVLDDTSDIRLEFTPGE